MPPHPVVYDENAETKEPEKAKKATPHTPVVPSSSSCLSTVVTEEELITRCEALTSDARARVEWLLPHTSVDTTSSTTATTATTVTSTTTAAPSVVPLPTTVSPRMDFQGHCMPPITEVVVL